MSSQNINESSWNPLRSMYNTCCSNERGRLEKISTASKYLIGVAAVVAIAVTAFFTLGCLWSGAGALWSSVSYIYSFGLVSNSLSLLWKVAVVVALFDSYQVAHRVSICSDEGFDKQSNFADFLRNITRDTTVFQGMARVAISQYNLDREKRSSYTDGFERMSVSASSGTSGSASGARYSSRAVYPADSD